MTLISAKRALAIGLVLCMLVVGGFASAQSITHESQHAHHQRATHATVLCSWMCAAGQVLDATQAPVLIEQPPVSLAEYIPYRFIPHLALDSAASRGPPAPSTT
jgi:hypothetical protein